MKYSSKLAIGLTGVLFIICLFPVILKGISILFLTVPLMFISMVYVLQYLWTNMWFAETYFWHKIYHPNSKLI